MGEETSTIIIKDGANIEILLVRYRFAESERTKTIHFKFTMGSWHSGHFQHKGPEFDSSHRPHYWTSLNLKCARQETGNGALLSLYLLQINHAHCIICNNFITTNTENQKDTFCTARCCSMNHYLNENWNGKLWINLGWSHCQVVMGGDSCSRSYEFESLRGMLDG